MKRFIIRSLVYLSPLLLVVAVVLLVDPYYLFNKNAAFNEDKYEIGYSFDQGRRYKIFTYWNNPTDKIILGASEINIINERNIPENGWHSLSYGGAPLQESLRMYWEVSKEHHLTKVIIAPEFIKFYNAISSGKGDPYYANFSWGASQSAKALDIYNNKFDYFIDKYTLKSAWNYLISQVKSHNNRSKPKGTKAEFWESQMDYARKIYGVNVVFEEKLEELLGIFSKIKEDADENGTEIMIVIPVQHVELLREEFQDGVYDVYHRYINSLIDIFGGVYYLAYTQGISDNDEMFSDPFHCKTERPYLEALFGNHKIEMITKDNLDQYLESVKMKLFEQ